MVECAQLSVDRKDEMILVFDLATEGRVRELLPGLRVTSVFYDGFVSETERTEFMKSQSTKGQNIRVWDEETPEWRELA
jgi:predicted secreted protein